MKEEFLHDPVRQRNLVAGPEEQVRQAVIDWLMNTLNVPRGLMAVEKTIRIHGLARRPDIVVYDRNSSPWLIVECKAPAVPLDRSVAEQVANYNSVLKAPFVMVTNGRDHMGIQTNHATGETTFVTEIPPFPAR